MANAYFVAAGAWLVVALVLVAVHEYNHCRGVVNAQYGVRSWHGLPQPYAQCEGVRIHHGMRDPISLAPWTK